MKIKSLLLGSAAAMFAVSGASAADAIVAAEPEPVEYVRVCDAFGNGYFYIPGTETCLRISGYVWFQIGANSDVDTWSSNTTRARVNIDARSDTEWGELASRVRVQADWGSFGSTNDPSYNPFSQRVSNNGDGPARIDQAWLRLGGLFMGYSESYWANAYNTGASNWGSHTWGGMGYGYDQKHLMGYTYNSGTFFVAGSIEQPDGIRDSWNVDATGKIGGTFGGATVWLKVGYDANNPLGDGDSGTGVGAGLALDLGPGNFRLLGYYADGNTDYQASNGPSTPEWSALASYGMDLGSNLYGSIGGQWYSNFYCADIGPASCTGSNKGVNQGSGADGWAAEAALVWTPVTNFEIRAELFYIDVDKGPNWNAYDSTSGFLRFQRSF